MPFTVHRGGKMGSMTVEIKPMSSAASRGWIVAENSFSSLPSSSQYSAAKRSATPSYRSLKVDILIETKLECKNAGRFER